MYKIAPSILSADFARLGEEVTNVIAAGADLIHFDVMDNHYVPNLTIGPCVLKSLRKYGVSVPIDVHLMVEPVDDLIKAFIDAGASQITFHPEASEDVDASIKLIQDAGLKAGIALNPDDAVDILLDSSLIQKIDLILIMTVNPGFGGQEIIKPVYDKIRQVRALIDKSGRDIILAVDGGVNQSNIKELADLGANMFVAGNAIFSAQDYKKRIKEFRNALI